MSPPWRHVLAWSVVFAVHWLVPCVSAGHHEVLLNEETPVRRPYGIYGQYGVLQNGYDYYSLATFFALKLKAAFIVAALFFGISWWYGLNGVKGGYGGYGGYGAQSKWSSDAGLPPGAFDRGDPGPPPSPPPPPPPPSLQPPAALPPRPRPRPSMVPMVPISRAPQHKYPEIEAENGRSAPEPTTTPMEAVLKGLELMDLTMSVLSPRRAEEPACIRRLGCELRRAFAAGRPLLERALAALGIPSAAEQRTQDVDCVTLNPGCQSSWERVTRDADRHANAGQSADDTGGGPFGT